MRVPDAPYNRGGMNNPITSSGRPTSAPSVARISMLAAPTAPAIRPMTNVRLRLGMVNLLLP
jgi:hypothetical protein